jgi:hypothetical protein
MPMLDRRRTRQLLIFLGNVVSGVVTPVVAFAFIASQDDDGPLAAGLLFVVAPFLGICGWLFALERRGRERDQAKRVAWQVFWVLIAWEAVPIVFVGTVIVLAYVGNMSIRSVGSIIIPIFSAPAGLAVWFTWVKSRRMVDLLWPLPGMPERGAESSWRATWLVRNYKAGNKLGFCSIVLAVIPLSFILMPTAFREMPWANLTGFLGLGGSLILALTAGFIGSRWWFFAMLGPGLIVVLLLGPNSRRRANEAVAVGKLRRITALQNIYANSHPTKGFACQLPLLNLTAPTRDNYDEDAFLLSADHAGYRIALTGCEPEADGVVTRYRVTAVPLELGKSGVRAFCIDQTGTLWYDATGSAENCLAARHTIN